MRRVSLFVAAAAVTAALTVAVLIALDGRSAPPIVIEDPLVDAMIVIAVDGAVATPGVFSLPASARLQDALAAAGGTLPDADLAGLNPARRLHDEDQIVVSRRPTVFAITDAPDVPPEPAPTPPAMVPGPDANQSMLDLNRATAESLDSLPGIGPALAARIVAHRDENGPFRSVEELALVDGISPRMVETLRPLVVVGG